MLSAGRHETTAPIFPILDWGAKYNGRTSDALIAASILS
jgi:hypothetical protein